MIKVKCKNGKNRVTIAGNTKDIATECAAKLAACVNNIGTDENNKYKIIDVISSIAKDVISECEDDIR